MLVLTATSAARLAMRALKSGADATAAVEIAIRCLEDMEITNAGYGSNLTIEGVVEADATIVDHLGRSGACGAVPGMLSFRQMSDDMCNVDPRHQASRTPYPLQR